MASGTILVTGGAGYIGSHVVRQLCEAGEAVVVLDDLSTGFESAVLGAPLVVGNTGERDMVTRLLDTHRVETVMHFAARTIVPESVADPLRYYGNNTCATRNLLECCQRQGVRHIVFSSTAAVYGIPEGGRAREDSPTSRSIRTALEAHERMDAARSSAASPLRHVILRYFNVAGCDPGDAHRPVDGGGDAAVQGRRRSRRRQAQAAQRVRHRLSDAGRHWCARLHPRRGSGRRARARAALPASRAASRRRSTAATVTAIRCAK